MLETSDPPAALPVPELSLGSISTSTRKSGFPAVEFIQYVGVGGLAFFIDWSMLTCGVAWGMHYLAAAALGFAVGLLTNFALCVMWVWRGTKARGLKDFIVFSAIGLGGLALTELGMWIGVGLLGFGPSPVKVAVAGVVLMWNFTLRKLMVFCR